MTTSDERTPYGSIQKTLHWVAALCVLLAWTIGTIGDDIPRAAEVMALSIHMSLGLTVFVILTLRLVWRFADPPDVRVTRFSPWSDYLASISHWLLYSLMATVPVTGILLQFARGKALSIFGLLHIASPWPADRVLVHSIKDVHELLANSLVVLAALHVVAALFHHFVLRDQTLVRMLPWHHRLGQK